MLQLNLLSFAAHHFLTYPDDPSPGVVLYVALFSWFVCDYLIFERVHLYYLRPVRGAFGVQASVGAAWLGIPTSMPSGFGPRLICPTPMRPLGCWFWPCWFSSLAWVLARGANMQKFTFKQDPQRAFLGRIEPKAFSDGERQVLHSGFWGVSRHVNYLGEILMACGLGAGARLAAASRPVALPALLRGAAVSSGTRRRSPLR